MRAYAQLGGREKGNLFFGAWKRSTPYKNVLAQATAYHETLARIQAQPLQSEALATRLQELNAQLDRLRQSVQSYVDSPSQRLTRKPAMQALLTRIEAETRALAGLQAGAQPGGGVGDGGQGLQQAGTLGRGFRVPHALGVVVEEQRDRDAGEAPGEEQGEFRAVVDLDQRRGRGLDQAGMAAWAGAGQSVDCPMPRCCGCWRGRRRRGWGSIRRRWRILRQGWRWRHPWTTRRRCPLS